MRRDPLTYSDFQYTAELEHCVTIGGNRFDAMRITWRREGTRNWNSFLLIPDDGETFAGFAHKIPQAIEATAAGFAR